MLVREALKKYDYEKFGMSDDLIIECLGFDKIRYPEDLQTHILHLYDELCYLEAEAQAEFA